MVYIAPPRGLLGFRINPYIPAARVYATILHGYDEMSADVHASDGFTRSLGGR